MKTSLLSWTCKLALLPFQRESAILLLRDLLKRPLLDVLTVKSSIKVVISKNILKLDLAQIIFYCTTGSSSLKYAPPLFTLSKHFRNFKQSACQMPSLMLWTTRTFTALSLLIYTTLANFYIFFDYTQFLSQSHNFFMLNVCQLYSQMFKYTRLNVNPNMLANMSQLFKNRLPRTHPSSKRVDFEQQLALLNFIQTFLAILHYSLCSLFWFNVAHL